MNTEGLWQLQPLATNNQKTCIAIRLNELQIPETKWRAWLKKRYNKTSRTQLTEIEAIDFIDFLKGIENMTTSQELWNKPYSPEGYLPEDGDYYGIIADLEQRMTQKGEVLDIKLTVSEGQYAGQELKTTIFYETEGGMKAFQALCYKVDAEILKLPSLQMALTQLANSLGGRKVKFTQVPNRNNPQYKNIFIGEVYEQTGLAF